VPELRRERAGQGLYLLVAKGVCPILVLTRRVEEVLWIGDSIRVEILRADGGNVRIGISAPEELLILREELLEPGDPRRIGRRARPRPAEGEEIR
jgi:carbon storage regulator